MGQAIEVCPFYMQHANIQDIFHGASIEVMSPHLMGVHPNDQVIMPDEYLQKKTRRAKHNSAK